MITPTIRLGFVDKNLHNWHAGTFLSIFRNDLKDRGAVVAGCISLDPEGQSWAETNGVPYCSSMEQLDRIVDAYMILAPNTPQSHWELCHRVFPFGKPTYVDKTFAPDVKTARAIFELADKYSVRVQSASALRYTAAQQYVQQTQHAPRHMVAWGGGSSFDVYAIHVVELIVSCMGPGATRLMRRNDGSHSQLLIDFTDNRTAVGNICIDTDTGYAASITTAKGTRHFPPELCSFTVTAGAVLDFLQGKTPPIDRAQTLSIMRILEVANMPEAQCGFVEI